jgi:UDP-N-acetylglucosamine transferase subunit ALG13
MQEILATAPDICFLPHSERMQELTNGVSAIVIGPCGCGSLLSTMLEQGKRSVALQSPDHGEEPQSRTSRLATASVAAVSRLSTNLCAAICCQGVLLNC